MRITRDNLNNTIFENENARLLILDVVSHTTANLYYYYDVEITERKALDIWYKAFEQEGYSVSLLDSKCIADEFDTGQNTLSWKCKNRSQNSTINPLKLEHSKLLVRSGMPQTDMGYL